MDELGINLRDQSPSSPTREMAEWADVVVMMGRGGKCPFVPGVRYVDWDLPDPFGRPVDEVRATGNDFSGRNDQLLAELDACHQTRRRRCLGRKPQRIRFGPWPTTGPGPHAGSGDGARGLPSGHGQSDDHYAPPCRNPRSTPSAV
jgi:hypothetical protein